MLTGRLAVFCKM